MTLREQVARGVSEWVDHALATHGRFDSHELADAILALLIPPGHVVVPEEPTREMLNAAPAREDPGEESMYATIYRAMLAASPPVPGASGWQDIGPEQRDGKPILAGSVNHTCREVVCWQDDGEDGNEGWVNTGPVKDRFYPNPRWFTHWQPLPEPPAGEDKP